MPLPASPLIDPTNRLLGWSTSDFSLYGGQPATMIGAPGTTAPRGDDAALTVSPGPAPNATSGDDGQVLAPSDDAAISQAADAAPIALAYPAQSAIAAAGLNGDHAAGASESAVPLQAPGSGSFAAIIPTGFASHDGGTSPFAAPALHPAAPSELAAMLAPHHAGDLAAPILDIGNAAFHDVGVAASNVTTALDHLAALDVGAAVGDALPNVADLLLDESPLTAADQFAGADPVGGISTLVTMVDSADAFDLVHTSPDVPVLGASASILDSLAGDHVTDSLLGDTAHHDDLLSPDHHDAGALGIL